MTKIYVAMTDEEFVRLTQVAMQDCRHPRDQARHFIRQALGLTDNESRLTGSQNSKSATGEVFQAEQVSAFAGVNP